MLIMIHSTTERIYFISILTQEYSSTFILGFLVFNLYSVFAEQTSMYTDVTKMLI